MTQTLRIKFLKDTDTNFPLPAYETLGAAGLDLRAYLPKLEQENGRVLLPGDRALIASGFMIEIPYGFEGQVRSRSGLALKHGVSLGNGVGTIDSDYRGALGIIMINNGLKPFLIRHGARIAQIIISPIIRVRCEVVIKPSITVRDSSGFGSTGEI